MLEGRGPDSASEYQSGGPGVPPPEQFWKTFMWFGALYCNWYIKNINLENSKVLFFMFYMKNYLQLYKNLLEIKMH